MKLYLAVINWGMHSENQEAEWFHFVNDKYNYDEALGMAKQHLVDNLEVNIEDVEINDLWINEVKVVDGYKIKVAK